VQVLGLLPQLSHVLILCFITCTLLPSDLLPNTQPTLHLLNPRLPLLHILRMLLTPHIQLPLQRLDTLLQTPRLLIPSTIITLPLRHVFQLHEGVFYFRKVIFGGFTGQV